MRASSGGRHISGAERIVPLEKMDLTVQELVARARGKAKLPEQIVIHIECLGDMSPRTMTALDVVTLNVPDVIAGRTAASRVLQAAGVSARAAETALSHLSRGAAPSGSTMRGALVMDAQSGERLEPDHERGVRASRFDWSDEASLNIDRSLSAVGLTHFRTREAIALATKVAHAPGMVAELCWSDEPDYIAGYVASRTTGYVRIPILKQIGDPIGGRAFFVDRNAVNLDELITYLQNEAVLITEAGVCRSAVEPEEYFSVF